MTVACHPHREPRSKEGGQILLGLLVLLGIALSVFVYNVIDPAEASARRAAHTETTLREARDALVGRAASDANRPGSLPCPDINNDGILTLGVDYGAGGVCTSLIGRLPWRTLGLPDLRDDAGERLWYALSDLFSDNAGTGPINSDTRGNITVYQDSASPASKITSEAVAIIFAPGPVVAGQIRDPTNANNPANYLDTADGVNNATPTANPPIAPLPSFIVVAAPSSYNPPLTFNDKALVVTTADLIPVVEQRVARELRTLLMSYRSASTGTSPRCNCYTWADEDFTNEGDNDAYRGWLPLGEGDPHIWGPPPADYSTTPVNLGIDIPAWLTNNDWWKVIYYAVAPDQTQYKTGGTLTVDGAAGTQVVLITPGPPPEGVSRPVNSPSANPAAYWAEYLKDGENSDHSNNSYVTPSSTAYARNRLYTIP